MWVTDPLLRTFFTYLVPFRDRRTSSRRSLIYLLRQRTVRSFTPTVPEGSQRTRTSADTPYLVTDEWSVPLRPYFWDPTSRLFCPPSSADLFRRYLGLESVLFSPFDVHQSFDYVPSLSVNNRSENTTDLSSWFVIKDPQYKYYRKGGISQVYKILKL